MIDRRDRPRVAALLTVLAALPVGTAVNAQQAPLAAESFQIGNSGSVCEAQGVSLRGQRQSLFDRKWSIQCRDAQAPVGSAWRLDPGSALPVEDALTCAASAMRAVPGVGQVETAECRDAQGVQWLSYSYRTPRARFMVRGLSGYDSALRLALQSLATNRQVAGEVQVVRTGTDVATRTGSDGPADPEAVIGQGYRRNNAGDYVQAAELFDPVSGAPADASADDAAESARRQHEMAVNRALQLSNLREFGQSARLFAEARQLASNDPIQTRLSRNFEAIDALNRGELDEGLAILARPMPPLATALESGDRQVRIDPATARGLNTGGSAAAAAIVGLEVRLTLPERARIIDAQGDQIRGTLQRLQGKLDEAAVALQRADADALAVRQGRVVSITRLRSQILSEQAAVAEAQDNPAKAEALLRTAQALVETQYPDSVSLNSIRARLAGFLLRHGKADEGRATFRAIVENVAGGRGALIGMSNLIQPYFELLAGEANSNPAALSDLFMASQLIERPGAADSLTQLARQLQSGNGEAADLFRQSLSLSRDIERGRIRIAQANAALAAGMTAPQLPELQQLQARLGAAQLQVLNRLAAFPQFRTISRDTISLEDLRGVLHPGEGYLKLAQLGNAVYAVLVTPQGGKGWKLEQSAGDVAALVGALRDSISVTVNGVRSTYPFDLDSDARLSQALLGPIQGELGGIRHLIFEPDGAMLQLPLNLLVTDPAGIAAYHARVDQQGGDEYDFRGIAWLGRSHDISTALSAASFRDARKSPASTARRGYLGLGENQPLGAVSALPASVRSVAGGLGEAGCDWPVAAWNNPISADELRGAAGSFDRSGAQLVTDAAFSDSAVMAMPDLADYRVVHFATHGLTNAPREGCPARPALLTSFGPGNSDGLLRFDEIFNLHMDADLVILSACDTASQAGEEATREAGVLIGGGQALDGLVRAFIAAGGRQVIASHWPAPDDYHATGRLFAQFFGGKGETTGDALKAAQIALMDDPETSHPFYWAGFALIGDGARALAPN